MEKTKLGISVALMGALVFLSGYFGITVLVLVGGYIFLKEESRTLKKYVVYTLVFYLVFFAVTTLLGLVSNVLNVVNVNSWIYSVHVLSTIYSFVRNCIAMLNSVISIVETLVFGLLAVGALLRKEIKLAVLDKFVDKHF